MNLLWFLFCKIFCENISLLLFFAKFHLTFSFIILNATLKGWIYCLLPSDPELFVLLNFLCFSICTFSIFHKINNQISMTMQRNDSFHQSRNLNLIDDSVLEDSTVLHNSLHLPLQQSDAISTGSSEEIIPFDGDYNETSIINNLDSPLDCMSFQGCVRRKTVLKDGRKPTVASWQRYWLQIWANSLVYFPPKSFKG